MVLQQADQQTGAESGEASDLISIRIFFGRKIQDSARYIALCCPPEFHFMKTGNPGGRYGNSIRQHNHRHAEA
jgi:hypothetical protein